VIDPLRMKSRAGRDKFDAAIKAAFGPELDGAVQIGGFTRLGLYEFSRQRAGESLAARILVTRNQAQLNAVSALNNVLRNVVGESRAGLAGTVCLYVASGIAQRLAESDDARQILIRAFGTVPQILADPALENDSYRLEKN
jgi:ribonuclease E